MVLYHFQSNLSNDPHNKDQGKVFDNAKLGIQMSEKNIYEWFGDKKLDNCGLILGEEGNLSILEFESVNDLERLLKSLEMKGQIKYKILYCMYLENLYSSTTLIHIQIKVFNFGLDFLNYFRTLYLIKIN